jgi:hypothetical protein
MMLPKPFMYKRKENHHEIKKLEPALHGQAAVLINRVCIRIVTLFVTVFVTNWNKQTATLSTRDQFGSLKISYLVKPELENP